MFDAAGGAGKPRVGQIAVCLRPRPRDGGAARPRAVPLVRPRLEGQRRPARPASFDAATQFVTPEEVAEQLACGPDVEEHVEEIRPFIDAGFTEIALVQIGGDHQDAFIGWAEAELLPALRSL